MAKRKTQSKQKDSNSRADEIADQLEQAFLAGLGALGNAQKAGGKAFDTLVEQGKTFRKQTTHKSEALIDDVQGAIRGMASDAQSKASGLLDQMRDTPQLDKIQGVFDSRVADALGRIGVASKQDVAALNAKLDRLIKLYANKKSAAKKSRRTSARKKTTRTPARKTTARKVVAKASTRKAPAKRTKKKVAKKAAKKRATKRG